MSLYEHIAYHFEFLYETHRSACETLLSSGSSLTFSEICVFSVLPLSAAAQYTLLCFPFILIFMTDRLVTDLISYES